MPFSASETMRENYDPTDVRLFVGISSMFLTSTLMYCTNFRCLSRRILYEKATTCRILNRCCLSKGKLLIVALMGRISFCFDSVTAKTAVDCRNNTHVLGGASQWIQVSNHGTSSPSSQTLRRRFTKISSKYHPCFSHNRISKSH